MPTRERLQARAIAEDTLDLHDAALRAGYASETLRKMMVRDPHPPPLFKFRGRWRARIDELDVWIAERDAVES